MTAAARGAPGPHRHRIVYTMRFLPVRREQGLAAGFLFPTLAVGMEEALRDDIPALVAAFRAFNRWMDDDWGSTAAIRATAAT